MSLQFTVLVVAKAPVPGQVKTRIGELIGAEGAADLAAAALLDTLDAVRHAAPPGRRVVAVAGDLSEASRGAELASALRGVQVISQRGTDFAARLVAAHSDAAAFGTPVVQVGMDTPQLVADDLVALVSALDGEHDPTGLGADAVLGPAADGGWWGLALRTPGWAEPLRDVEMSTPVTGAATIRALRAGGARVTLGHELSDVDTWDDARQVARTLCRTSSDDRPAFDPRFVRAVARWSARVDRPCTTV